MIERSLMALAGLWKLAVAAGLLAYSRGCGFYTLYLRRNQ